MANNIDVLDAASATKTMKTTDNAGVHTAHHNVDSSALPTGASTAALQTQPGVDIGDVTVNNAAGASAVNIQDGGNSITVDGTVTATGPLTDTELRATPVPISGTVTANLAAGTNNIGDVDVLTVPAPLSTTGGGTEATALRVTIASDSTGVVSIDDNGSSITVDGTVAVSGTVAVIGEVAHDAAAGTNGVLVAGYAKAAAPTDVSLDGDAVRAWYLRNGSAAVTVTAAGALIGGDAANGLDVDVTRLPALVAGTANIGDVDVLTVPAPLSTTGGGTEATALRVTLASDSTGLISIDDNGSSITVDGTVAVSGAIDTELPAAAALTDNFANPTAPGVGAFGMVWDGATWDRAAGTSADGTLVNLGANNDVTVTSGSITADTELPTAAALADNAANPTAPAVGAFGMVWDGATWDRAAGTSADGTLVNLGANNDVVQATASNLNAQVVGSVASDSPDSGNPIKIGGKARQTNPVAVSNSDRVDASFDDVGRMLVALGNARDLITHQHTQIASSSSETTILTAVANTFLDLTQLVLTNQTATAVNVTIKDSTAGTTRMIIALAASGGAVVSFPRPVTQATVNNNWTATLSSAAVTVNIFAQAENNV